MIGLTQLIADANDAGTFTAAAQILAIAAVELRRLPVVASMRDGMLDIENIAEALEADARDSRASAARMTDGQPVVVVTP